MTICLQACVIFTRTLCYSPFKILVHFLLIYHHLLLLLVFCCSNSRSMTPITWQAAVDDEEQRPLLQDLLEV